MKSFATAKEDVRCSEEYYENKTSLKFVVVKLSFAVGKRFATMKTPFASAKKGSNKRCHMASPRQRSLHRGEELRART